MLFGVKVITPTFKQNDRTIPRVPQLWTSIRKLKIGTLLPNSVKQPALFHTVLAHDHREARQHQRVVAERRPIYQGDGDAVHISTSTKRNEPRGPVPFYR